LAGEDAQQGGLAGAVRPGQREALAALDLERDAVEEQGAGQLLAQVGGDHDGHGVKRSAVKSARNRAQESRTGRGHVTFLPVPSAWGWAGGLAPPLVGGGEGVD